MDIEVTVNEETLALVKRMARFFADSLAQAHPNAAPTLRLRMAYEAAMTMVLQAKWSGNLDLLVRNLDRQESTHYEI